MSKWNFRLETVINRLAPNEAIAPDDVVDPLPCSKGMLMDYRARHHPLEHRRASFTGVARVFRRKFCDIAQDTPRRRGEFLWVATARLSNGLIFRKDGFGMQEGGVAGKIHR